MNATKLITYEEAAALVTWPDAVAALRKGHTYSKAQVADVFLGPLDGSLLSRAAYIEEIGYGVKSVTVFRHNPKVGLSTVQGAMQVFEPRQGMPTAIIESKLVTELKTAADSVLGAMLLARVDSSTLLIVGAGTVARSLISAYSALFPTITHIHIWARRMEQAKILADAIKIPNVEITAVADLCEAASNADIISSATMASEPVLYGDWVQPGTHVDLIGAFKADMREADDKLISQASLFVDSRDTTIHHIGELRIPIASGVITADSVRGDLYDLVQGSVAARQLDEEITVFKNGGGAHLDLMIANYITTLIA